MARRTVFVSALGAAVRLTGLHRRHISAARMYCERVVLARRRCANAASAGRILCYHSVGTPEWGTTNVSRERFQAQLSASLDAGFSFVPAERIARGLGSANELAVTFDDGRRSVADFAAPILTELEIPATLFVVSNWADGKHPFPTGTMLGWRDIEQLVATGFAVGSHSVTHRNFRELSPDEATFELFESRRMIEQRIGITPRAFAIPFGRSQDWTAAAGTAAREAGYDTIYAASVSLRPEGTVARTTITRFDGDRVFRALLNGAFDRWEEWIL